MKLAHTITSEIGVALVRVVDHLHGFVTVITQGYTLSYDNTSNKSTVYVQIPIRIMTVNSVSLLGLNGYKQLRKFSFYFRGKESD